jgi:transposase InsO family protein
VHDRDTAFHAWATTAQAIGIDEVITAARSPWQNAYAERLIGSIRRECLDHIIVGNARGLRRVLNAYVEYYLKSRTHLSLSKDAPMSRPVASPSDGEIVAIPQLGGLHHRLRTLRGIKRSLIRSQRPIPGERRAGDCSNRRFFDMLRVSCRPR